MEDKKPNGKIIKEEKPNLQVPFGTKDFTMGGDIPSLKSELRFIKMSSLSEDSEQDIKKPNGR